MAFIGWALSGPGVVIRSISAPIIDSRGKGRGTFPAARNAAESAATSPDAIDSTYPSTPVIWPAKKRPARSRDSIQGWRCRRASRNVLRCTDPNRRNPADESPGISEKTRFCSG
ncbi:MAG: hypothetical protein A2559_09900 [Deltaproteobacteria bacterium RIFOXYD2_FULL_66_9]|nr:MAG: hypothetical protein A2559_09900 [Deltaproteobacteria bacterium RIFOXYD2_FULL_66_9]